MVTIEEMVQILVQRGGSDLHLTAGSPPRIRIDGHLVNTEHDVLDPETTQKLIYSILDGDQIARFERDLELDLSFGIQGCGRFRTNVFQQRGAVGAVLRVIPFEIKNFKQLNLPQELCERLCSYPRGMVLITGATGSGKSTTLAAMLDFINDARQEHVITIEDPIEFVHRNKKCLFNQREVGADTRSFKAALRSVLREDPDVVLIGEMRDVETMEAGLQIAETGHLAFSTLHTSDAVQTISRIIDAFPAYQQAQIRTVLSFVLNAVFCQQLLPRGNDRGRVLCSEIMVATSAIKALIRDDKCHQVYSMIQTGGKFGMCTMNQSLFKLHKEGSITYDMAMTRSSDPMDLRRIFDQGGV